MTDVAEEAPGVGIFHNLTFTLLGFDADTEAQRQLTEMIVENGGVYLTMQLVCELVHLADALFAFGTGPTLVLGCCIVCNNK